MTENFKHFRMAGECPDCGCHETKYVGDIFIDEKCCWCGRIVGGGYPTKEDARNTIYERERDTSLDDTIKAMLTYAEQEWWYWGTYSPFECLGELDHLEDDPETELKELTREMIHHMAAYNTAKDICNAMYSELELDDRVPDDRGPPWLDEYQERRAELEEMIIDE